jgi:hypothetical protein
MEAKAAPCFERDQKVRPLLADFASQRGNSGAIAMINRSNGCIEPGIGADRPQRFARERSPRIRLARERI